MSLKDLVMAQKEREEDKIIPWINAYLEEVQDTGRYTVYDEKKYPDPYFHPSGDGVKCQRQLFYEKTLMWHGDLPADTLRIFKTGHAIHSMVQHWLTEMGNLEGFPDGGRDEVGIGCDVRWVRGSIDYVINLGGRPTIIEIKTMNTNKFERLYVPEQNNVLQVNLYQDIKDIDDAILLYVQKDYPHAMKEFRVKRRDMSKVYSRWDNVRRAIEANNIELLPKEHVKGDRECGWCPYQDICYVSQQDKSQLPFGNKTVS